MTRSAMEAGFFQHGHTYIGHPVATAAALAVVRELTGRDLPTRAGVMGNKVQSALEAALGQHPNVGDIRGRGLFRGVELVADRDTKTPFDPALGVAGKIKKAAMKEGLICYPMSGTRDGRNGRSHPAGTTVHYRRTADRRVGKQADTGALDLTAVI